jgi:chemotaxis protein methyltransferase WspC
MTHGLPPAPLSVAVRTAAELLRGWIGMDVATVGEAALERVIRGRMTAVGEPDADAYARVLDADAAERDRLVEEIVVAESWFFRDLPVFDVLRRFAATRMQPARRPLRVLCAPCAAGEEPFSVAMALLEEGLPASSFSIDAVDVSRTALARAATATYSANAFRTPAPGFRERWFRQEGAAARLDDAVRRCVAFTRGNVLDEAFLVGREGYDVIFCRNLLIYLTADARERVERMLDRLLAADGLLVLGAAEPPILRGPWIPAAHQAAFALRRGSPQTAAAAPPPAALPRSVAALPPRPARPRPALPRPAPPHGARPLPGPLPDRAGTPTADVAAPQALDPMPDCWRTIGISGDRSCPELERFIHCRNCPVVADAARAFFDRPAPEGYLESWRHVLEQPEVGTDPRSTSVLVFRLGEEWLGLPATVLVEIAPPRRVHRLPHARSAVLEGLVNIRGQLRPCIDLGRLLGLERTPGPVGMDDRRLLVVDHRGDCWVLAVDQVAGVHRVPQSSLRSAPSTVSAGSLHATTALFVAHDRTVGLLDEARLLDGLRDRILA